MHSSSLKNIQNYVEGLKDELICQEIWTQSEIDTKSRVNLKYLKTLQRKQQQGGDDDNDDDYKMMNSLVCDLRKTLEDMKKRSREELVQESVLNTTTSHRLSTTSPPSHDNVHAVLQRTKQEMANQMKRVGAVSTKLDDGRRILKDTRNRHGEIKGTSMQSKALLTEIERQEYIQNVWIAAGLAIFGLIVLYILHVRIGRCMYF